MLRHLAQARGITLAVERPDALPRVTLGSDALRQVLLNHARDKSALKRGGGEKRQRLTLSAAVDASHEREVDFLTLDEELEKLAELDERQARIAELKLLAGLQNKEVAEVVGVSLRTVELDWQMAKGWLSSRLAER